MNKLIIQKVTAKQAFKQYSSKEKTQHHMSEKTTVNNNNKY